MYCEGAHLDEPEAPILRAALHGDLETLRRELASGVSPFFTEETEDEEMNLGSAIHMACRWRVSDDIDVDDDPSGFYPDERKLVAVVKELLAAGVPPTAKDGDGFTVVDLAAYHGRPLILAALIEAAGPDAIAMVNEYKDGCFFTPLHTAVREGCVECVKVLLRAGADVARGGSSYPGSPMEFAVLEEGRRRRLYPILLAAGATIPPDANDAPWKAHVATLVDSDAYLCKVRAAGGFKAYEKAHLTQLLAIFAPKFTHLVPPELVARFLEFSFHVGFY